MTVIDDDEPPGGWDEDPDYRWDPDGDEIDRIIGELDEALGTTASASIRFVDWDDLWDKERVADDWLYHDVFARGRGHALYAKHKVGKSLFVLAAAAEMILTDLEVAVLYLDYEMTEDDLRDRLEDMGYGPDNDFSRFHYALLPTLPPLDTAHGGEALDQVVEQVQQAHPGCHLFVVIDTTGRAVNGEENAADTFQDFYRFTGIRLKRRQVTWVRLDHAGKDSGMGMRGSSAKGDDVDLVWKIDKAEDGVVLKRELSRISWAKEKVTFAMTTEPLRYRRAVVYLSGTKEVADLLDDLGFPLDGTGNAAVKFLREAGEGRKRELVHDAVRHRREQQR